MGSDALKAVTTCLEKQVKGQPDGGVAMYIKSFEGPGGAVLVEVAWGASGDGKPWVVKTSSVTGGTVGHTLPLIHWPYLSKKPEAMLLLREEIDGLQLKGSSSTFRRITRSSKTSYIDIIVTLENGKSAHISIPPYVEPPQPKPFKTDCTWTAGSQKQPGTQM